LCNRVAALRSDIVARLSDQSANEPTSSSWRLSGGGMCAAGGLGFHAEPLLKLAAGYVSGGTRRNLD
jgi:hypothetical protein